MPAFLYNKQYSLIKRFSKTVSLKDSLISKTNGGDFYFALAIL